MQIVKEFGRAVSIAVSIVSIGAMMFFIPGVLF